MIVNPSVQRDRLANVIFEVSDINPRHKSPFIEKAVQWTVLLSKAVKCSFESKELSNMCLCH